MTNFHSWKHLELGIKNQSTIDEKLQHQMRAEVQHWREALKRLIMCVQFLGVQSLAFRGGSEVLYAENNGNFLKLVEMIATFDPILKHHLQKIQCAETRLHYLSSTIQNEMIQLISRAVKSKISRMMHKAKYFSIIVDCAPDRSHVEQTTIIARFVGQNEETGLFEVREHFLGFQPTSYTTGKGITDLILNTLQNLGLSIQNCRGQGYDNGSNMKGKNIGVQNRIREIEPRAFYVPCGSHSLNLVVNDGANCSADAVEFFDNVQSLYVIFSKSSARWEIFKNNVHGLTLKPLSDTRWESRIDAIKPLLQQLARIHEALVQIVEQSEDTITSSTATGIAKKITQFKFVCIW